MAQIIDGKQIAATIRGRVAAEVATLKSQGITPGLAVVLVGEDPASMVYVRMKDKAALAAGIASRTLRLPEDTSSKALLQIIEQLNQDPEVHGILIQLPLPPHLDANAAVDAISPEKDVDGLHPINAGMLALGRPGLVPCTPLGILELLVHQDLVLKGKRAVVVGRSNLVGKPTAALLTSQDATVTLCHSRTRDLGGVIAQAEVVVAAIGRPHLIQGSWIRPGAVVIDVGINRLPDGRLVGDVEFDVALANASAITPVPGGVGPMTVAMLLSNTVKATKNSAIPTT